MSGERKPLILNVNDHFAHLYMVSKMLRNAGFQVVEAKTGREAIELANERDTKPDLIVLDIKLPDLSGFEVCRRLKTDPATRDIKILHTSAAFSGTETKIEGLEAGADGYLTQPFEPQDLIATVRSLIRLHEVEADLQARNDQLIEADRRKDEFLAMLAHELRNPLAAIQMGLPMLERFPPRDTLEERTIAIMHRQTALLIRLVDDLLDVSRVTRGRIELKLRPVDLGALVTSVCDGMRERVFGPRDQTLVCQIDGMSVVVHGDPGRLEQVLTNLLDNASKYSDAGSLTTVKLVVSGGFAQVSVRDHGVGIDAAMLPTVFELFAQASTTLARSRGGLGIGLTLVKTLVNLHGGSIVAESSGIGKGSEFRIRLPLLGDLRRSSPALPTVATPRESCRILLVDDNEDARVLLRSLCELEGHTVEEAGDGPSGVEQALAFGPDVAFIDIGLPGIDGYEVARQLRAKQGQPRMRLVALSGYGSDEHRQRALESGFDEHVVKPIELAKLQRIVASAMGAR
ncbi:MAG TPA: response regulator [Kofleriaceae bacterium]|nr:response regulator [Kofleriaceae bacterium]